MSGPRVAAVDIGGTKIKAGLVTDGVVSGFQEIDTQPGKNILDTVEALLKEYRGVDRIGVATAGQVDPVQGHIHYANENLPGYTGTQVRQVLEARFSVPVTVENDANAAALAEHRWGAAQNAPGNSFLCLTYGTGIGGAIVEGGRLIRGAGHCAGGFGAMVVHPEDRARGDPFAGCYERYASTAALVRRVQAMDPLLDDGRKIFAQIHMEPVRRVVDCWIGEIAIGLTSLVHIFNPPLIVLGGGIMREAYILERLRDMLPGMLIPSCLPVALHSARLGNKAGLLGAALLATQRRPTN